MVLYIIPPNSRQIAEILKELEQERRLGQTDEQRQTIIPVGANGGQG